LAGCCKGEKGIIQWKFVLIARLGVATFAASAISSPNRKAPVAGRCTQLFDEPQSQITQEHRYAIISHHTAPSTSAWIGRPDN
jgi:hypothetical protein